MKTFEHIVKISSVKFKLDIYRRFENGDEEYCTSIDLPSNISNYDEEVFRNFANEIGTIILIDSPEARKIFDI